MSCLELAHQLTTFGEGDFVVVYLSEKISVVYGCYVGCRPFEYPPFIVLLEGYVDYSEHFAHDIISENIRGAIVVEIVDVALIYALDDLLIIPYFDCIDSL